MAKGIEISLEKMVVETYQKMAEWHNEDGTAPGLKVASHEIVERILDLAFEQLDVKTKTGIKEEAIKQVIDESKKQKTTEKAPNNKKSGDNNILKKIF